MLGVMHLLYEFRFHNLL